MQAIVDLIKQETPECFRDCAATARFIIWADWTNDDGEHGDVEPIEACEAHLPDACVTKIDGHLIIGGADPQDLWARLAELAHDIKDWDADRLRIAHQEDHEGGAHSRWRDSDDRAVAIVRAVQDLLGAPAKATPVKICPPDDQCEACAAIGN